MLNGATHVITEDVGEFVHGTFRHADQADPVHSCCNPWTPSRTPWAVVSSSSGPRGFLKTSQLGSNAASPASTSHRNGAPARGGRCWVPLQGTNIISGDLDVRTELHMSYSFKTLRLSFLYPNSQHVLPPVLCLPTLDLDKRLEHENLGRHFLILRPFSL